MRESEQAKEMPAGVGGGNARRPFEKPRLRFVEPKLVPQGDLAEVTKGFFGTFSP